MIFQTPKFLPIDYNLAWIKAHISLSCSSNESSSTSALCSSPPGLEAGKPSPEMDVWAAASALLGEIGEVTGEASGEAVE